MSDDASPRRLRRLGRWTRRRAPVLVVSGVLTVALVLQERGEVVSDTKLDLLLDPGRFLRRSLDLWDPTASFGRLQNQAVGYWFPMGPFFWLGDLLGVPVWLVQRAWFVAIVLAALWGLLKLAEALDVGTPASRLLGAVAFATGPGVLIELGTRSPNVVPLALLPLVLLPLVHGSTRGSPRRWAAVSALVVLLVGGINAAVTGAALLVPLLFLLTREPGPRRRSLTGWWIVSVGLVTLWWWGPLLLQQRYGFDFTAYTEDAAATTSFTSLTEVVRGTGFWLARLVDGGNAWLPAGDRLVHDELAVLGTTLVAGLGLGGLAGRRMPERTFLVLCVVAGVAAMGSAYGGQLGGPFEDVVDRLLDGPLVVIRNLHKLGPLVALPLALGLVHLVGAAQEAMATWRPQVGDRRLRAPATVAVAAGGALVVLLVVAAALPIATEDVAQEGSYEDVPAYWREAADWLNARTDGDRTLVVPASTFPTYQWGGLTDEPLQSLSDGPWAVRDIIPFGGARSTRLLDGFEEVFEDARATDGLAEAMARAGVGWVLVRNDLDASRTAATDPVFVSRALDAAPGFERVAEFGPEVSTDLSRERVTWDLADLPGLRSLEVYRVVPEHPRVTTYDLASTYAVLGSTEAVQQLADQGVLEGRGTILAADDPALAEQAGRWAITDDLRLRDLAFGLIQDAESYTLVPGARSPDRRLEPVDRLLPGDEASQSHVELLGPIADVRASSYYRGFAREPGMQPWAALDGDPSTAWHIGGFREGEGEWIEIRFEEPVEVPTLTLRLPERLPSTGQVREVEVTTDAGEATGRFEDDEDVLRIELPPGETDRITVGIEEADRTVADLLPPGIAEIELEGIDAERVVVTPSAPTDQPATVVLSREPFDPFETVAAPEDLVLDRVVDLPATATTTITGTAVAVPGEELDALVALAGGAPSEPEVLATSSLQGLPAFGAAQAVDGDPRTAWVADVADPFPALALRWSTPQRLDGVRLTWPAAPGLAPERVIVTVDGEDRTLPVAEDGTVDLGGAVTQELRLAPDVADLDGRAFGLVGISELEVLRSTAGATTGPTTSTTAADPATVPVALPCGRGPDVVVDGEALATSVRGTLQDLERLTPLALDVCSTPELAAGEHRIRGPVDGALQVQSLVLDPEPPLPAVERREVTVESWGTEQRRLEVGGGDRPSLLALAENANLGWEATLDGEPLEPTVVDGWRQAWVLPSGSGGTVELAYAPGRTYDLLLGVGAVLVVLVLGLAVLRPRRARAGASAPARARAIPEVLVVVVGTLGLALAAGVVAVLVPATWALLRRPAWRVVLPVAAMLAIGALMVVDRLVYAPELAWQGQVLTGMALACAIVGPAVWSPRRRPTSDPASARDPDPAG